MPTKILAKIISLLFHHFAEGVLGIPVSWAPAERLFNYSVSLVKYSGQEDANLPNVSLKTNYLM